MRQNPLADRIAELKAHGLPFHSSDAQGIHHPLEVFEQAWVILAPIIEVEPYLYIIEDGWEVSAEWPVGNIGEVSLTLCIEGLYCTCCVCYSAACLEPEEDPVFSHATLAECGRWIRERLDEMRAAA